MKPERIAVGQTVRFAEVRELGDESLRFEVLWVDGARAMIRLLCDLPIAPTTIVQTAEILPAEGAHEA